MEIPSNTKIILPLVVFEVELPENVEFVFGASQFDLCQH